MVVIESQEVCSSILNVSQIFKYNQRLIKSVFKMTMFKRISMIISSLKKINKSIFLLVIKKKHSMK